MRFSFILSIGLHIFIIVLLSRGFDFSNPHDIDIAPPINIEIVEIADKNQTTKIAPPKKAKKPEKKKTEEKTKKKEPPKKTAKPNASAPKPKVDDSAVPLPDKVADKLVKPKPPKKIEKKVEPDLKRPELKETKMVKPIENDEPFQSVLKNLISDEPFKKEEEEKEAVQEVTQVASLSDRMTITEMDALRRQLEGCWNVPIGARDADNLIVDVRLVMNQDKTVRKAEIVDDNRYNSDPFFRAAADSALRAVQSDACNPLILPDGKYEQWQIILFRFNPQEMF